MHKNDSSYCNCKCFEQKINHPYKIHVIGIIVHNLAFRAPAWKQLVVGSRMPEQLISSEIY